MESVRLGTAGPEVSRVALGCMGMSGMYGPSDQAESIATIHAAMDAGITLLDTGDFYGMGHNEMLLSRALDGRRNRVLLSVKFGAMRGPDRSWLGMDGRPQAVKNFLAYTLERLQTDHIDIYRMARLDPNVPIEDTIGAIADMVKAGYVRYIGLSEVGAATIRRAAAVHPICDLQIEYALVTRGIEREILPVLRELGIGITAYGILSRGLLTASKVAAQGDIRGHMPRFAGANAQHNQVLVAELATFAANRRMTPAQVLVAWVLSRGRDIVPLIGARTRKQLKESLAALDTPLPADDLAQLDGIASRMPVAGTRYDANQMKNLDSER
jgi:aryl-alcohol dehydrogenase-like predicted oxidoreductase